MKKDEKYNLEEHKQLEAKYTHLLKKYQRLQSRFDTVVKQSDKELARLLEEIATYIKLDKRAESVIKQSDRQMANLLSQINEYSKLDKRFNIIIKHSDKQERQILEQKQDFEKKLEEEIKINQEQENLLKQQTKLAAMGEMIGNISHQFKQPLTIISSLVANIEVKRSMGSLKDADLSKKLNSINNNVHYLSDTIDDFRHFFDTNKTPKDFSLKKSIDRSYQLLATKFSDNNIKLVIDSIDDVIIYGKQNELLQVLMNIFSNAVYALQHIKDNKMIMVKTIQNDNSLKLIIIDNAKGISNDMIDKIFNAGFTTKKEDDGSGIGLYMSKRIIEEQFKGSISVENSTFIYEGIEHIGAKFTISFPKK